MDKRNDFSIFQIRKYWLIFWGIVLAIVALTVALISTSTLAAQKNGQEESVTHNGVNIKYYEYGDTKNPTVTVTGGWPWNSSGQIGQAKDLANRGLHVIRWEQPGAGNSDHPSDENAYSLPSMAEDFGAVIDKAAPNQHIAVTGMGWGPTIATEYSYSHPGRINALVSNGAPSLELGWKNLFTANQNMKTNPGSIPATVWQDVALSYETGFAIPKIPQALAGLFSYAVNIFSALWVGDYKDVIQYPAYFFDNPTNVKDTTAGISKYSWFAKNRVLPNHLHNYIPINHVHVFNDTQDPIETSVLLQGLDKETPHLEQSDMDANHISWTQGNNIKTVDQTTVDTIHEAQKDK